MRTSDKKIFKDPKKFSLMSDLRQRGWSYKSIAIVFGIDHSSVYHSCKKFHILKGKEEIDFGIKGILSSIGVKCKKEKMYADYLREAGYKPISHEFLPEETI